MLRIAAHIQEENHLTVSNRVQELPYLLTNLWKSLAVTYVTLVSTISKSRSAYVRQVGSSPVKITLL